jgi:N-acetylneuraminate synthase
MYFIAEIGVNHEGNLSKALLCIKKAKQAGAHAVKFQVYKAEKIASKYAMAYWDKKEEKQTKQLELFKKFDNFQFKDYEKLFQYCKKIKIDFIVTPFDVDSVKFFKNKVKFFKISSSDITNLPLIEEIAKTKKKIILSTGASTLKEVKNAIKEINKYNKKIILLHCILNYPTKKSNSNLNMIDDLKKLNLPVGISDHTKPKDSHEILVYAYIKGALFIEKHFTYNKNKTGNDHYHSFDRDDLKKFLGKIKDIDKILGSKKKSFIKSEKISRKYARRSLFLNQHIKKNSFIKKKDLISLRPGTGISPMLFRRYLGRKANADLYKGNFLKKINLI